MSICRYDDYAGFKSVLESSKNILVITGAGMSAESGIPVHEGAGEYWRRHKIVSLSTLETFQSKPALVWEYFHYRRSLSFDVRPTSAHIALARFEADCVYEQRKFQLVTMNVDGLHQRAGSRNVTEIHGALRKVKCIDCATVEDNFNDPICEAFRNRGDPSMDERSLPTIETTELPRCKHCGYLLRPHVVFYDEELDLDIVEPVRKLVKTCDLCLLIGTSSMVYPVAVYAPIVADRGRIVAEFNLNKAPFQDNFKFHFSGPCSITLPKALGYNFVY